MNDQFASWKSYLVVIAVAVGLIYALPNLFGSDLAIQLSKANNTPIDQSTADGIVNNLVEAGIKPLASNIIEGKLLLRFINNDDQLKAQAQLKKIYGRSYVIALNLAPAVPHWLSQVGGKPMFLGLDLRGGVHFLLEVDMAAALASAYERYFKQVRALLRKDRLYQRIDKTDTAIVIRFKTDESKTKGLALINDEIPGLALKTDNGLDVQLEFDEDLRREITSNALKQNITTLRNRVNELGVSEPVIQQQGVNRIVVQLPGVQDTARAKEILGAVATLEFRMVDEQNDPQRAARTGKSPVGSTLYRFRDGRPLLLKNRIIVTGENIVSASSGFSQQDNSPMVSLSLDAVGGNIMLDTTKKYLNQRMAVVFIENKVETVRQNGKLVKKKIKTEDIINAAVIRGVFSNRFQITGLDSSAEARNLALLLRAGSLSAPIEIIEERTVGPSLGQDNIDKGFASVLIGFFLVLVFMVWRYRIFGLVADIALTMNLVLLIAILSLLQATLTLPGIAGIVLTVGMAVDANVLIFERIREELKSGVKTSALAIQSGYSKAFSTITDANITTLIAAVVLFSFGTGPIKGFAVTLSIGILTSMFSAIVGSRTMVHWIYGGQRAAQPLSI